MNAYAPITATISGSYRKFPDLLASTIQNFVELNVLVLSPKSAKIIESVDDFVSLKGDVIEQLRKVSQNDLCRVMRTVENAHLKSIQRSNLLWLLLPDAYLGISTAFEIGWALAHQVPVYALYSQIQHSKEPIIKAYVNSAQTIEHLIANYYQQKDAVCPEIGYKIIRSITSKIHAETPLNSIVAVGAIIEDHSKKYVEDKRDILLVRTHKWGGKISVVGGRAEYGRHIDETRLQKVKQQTGINAISSELLCTFNELPNGGYYQQDINRVFVDAIVKSPTRKISLNDDAIEGIWVPPQCALHELDIEPNARKTIEVYVSKCLKT